MVLNPGTVLGDRYEIIEKIGSGGMAVVYRGKDKKLDRYVTVKVLREDFITDQDFIERFQTEARSAARLSHPNIVRVYDVGQDDDTHYIVMEYIHGDTLKKAIKEKAPFDSRSTINVGMQIASALSQAHKSHIIHRDIKPQNILVGTDGVVKVTDFGIARAATVSTMTTTANAAGSVHYFSPEQARGGYVDERSDIYSLGITMFEMITGILPFQGNNSVTIALKHIGADLPDIRQYNPNCNPYLEGIIKKATTKKADERYANIDLLLADLIRARLDAPNGAINQADTVAKPSDVAAEVAAVTTTPPSNSRMSRRAEVAAELRAAQKKMEDVPETTEMIDEEETLQPVDKTRQAEPKELEYIRMQKHVEEDHKIIEDDVGDDNEADVGEAVFEPLVSFKKYGKKLFLTEDDDYEEEYMQAVPVKSSKRPERQRRNPRKEPGYENEHDRKGEKKVIIAAIVTALVIIGAISVMGLRFFGGGFGGLTSNNEKIQMPAMIGVHIDDAKKTAQTLGIELVEEGEDYSSYYDEGYIIYQSVGEGTEIASGAKIGVKLSLGLRSETMPKLVDETENDAMKKIVELVGVSPDIVYEYNEEVEAGKVISQIPEEGKDINAKTMIRLTISKGEEGGMVLVPSVVGSSEAAARSALDAIGLVVGTVSHTESATVAQGNVITQTLSSGQEVPEGSVVNLVVSSGAPQVEEPTAPENPPDNGNGDVVTSGSKSFAIQAPSGADGDVYVRVIRNDANGVFPVVDEYRNATSFPYAITVTGTGSGTVSCYIDDVLQWSEDVNFGE